MSLADADEFCERARAASSTVHQVADVTAAATVVATLAGDAPVAVAPRMAADPVVTALRAVGVPVVVPQGDGDPVADVADARVGLVRGELAVAETGSVLVAEHALADRVVTMLCRRLVQVVDRAVIRARLEDVSDWLSARGGEPGFAALITGPSRTADIERSLTIGVQGSDEVDVVVVG